MRLASYQPPFLLRNLKTVTLTTLCTFNFKALYEEEGKCLLERKTSLNRLEGCQDYIVAFIDKILSAEGHCFLIHKKRVSLFVSYLFLKYRKISKTSYWWCSRLSTLDLFILFRILLAPSFEVRNLHLYIHLIYVTTLWPCVIFVTKTGSHSDPECRSPCYILCVSNSDWDPGEKASVPGDMHPWDHD